MYLYGPNFVKFRRKGKVSRKRFDLSLKKIYIHEMIIYHITATDAKTALFKVLYGVCNQ